MIRDDVKIFVTEKSLQYPNPSKQRAPRALQTEHNQVYKRLESSSRQNVITNRLHS